MAGMKWPQDWNRPLSEEERAIAKRLDRAPKDSGLGELVSSLNAGVSNERLDGGLEERRGEDSKVSIERAWVNGQCVFVDGDG